MGKAIQADMIGLAWISVAGAPVLVPSGTGVPNFLLKTRARLPGLWVQPCRKPLPTTLRHITSSSHVLFSNPKVDWLF
ncbi:hypothetical protein BJV78DRAFT_1188494 [Lactifluus subvellereus]|nr:hypothetical protein BJV78DRAFT_1188494 [Lactifluus subvellereus]